MKLRKYGFVGAVLFFSSQLQGQISAPEVKPALASPAAPTIDEGPKSIKIIYASSSWNIDPKQLDTAFLLLKDSTSGQIAKIILEETEPDSATFTGQFQLEFSSSSKFKPEVYIPPQSLRSSAAGSSRFFSLIQQSRLQKKPLVFRKDADGRQLVDVYDTMEQANRAKKVHESESVVPTAHTGDDTEQPPVPTETEKSLNAATNQRELQRIRGEQLERQRALQKEKEFNSLPPAERENRRNQAEVLAHEGINHFTANQFIEAEAKFKQAADLNPTEKSFYFFYATTLYRNSKFNEALVAFRLSSPPQDKEEEREYYIASCHYALNEYSSALDIFKKIKNTEGSTYAASAAFYEGLILLNQDKLDESKTSFEFVLDKSQDAEMDKQAELYIEKIMAMQRFKEEAKKKFFFNAMLGAMYDSNVLLAPDNVTSQGTSLQKGSPRLLFSGGGKYRLSYSSTDDVALALNTVYLYSTDTAVATADAAILNGGLPWTRKGIWREKGYNLVIKPNYEIVLMDPAASGQTPLMPVILVSPILNADLTRVNSDKKFTTYSLEVRSDDSRLPTVAPLNENETDAMRYQAKLSQTYLLDDSKKKMLLAGLGVVFNDAKGSNRKYMRYQGNVSFVAPTSWDALWNASLLIYQLNYDKATDKRKDFHVTLGAGFQKPINPNFSWGLMANVTENSSNVTSYDYSKYTVMTMASFNY